MTALSNTARRANSFFICSPMLFSDYTIKRSTNQGAFFKFSVLPPPDIARARKKGGKTAKIVAKTAFKQLTFGRKSTILPTFFV